MILFIRLKVKTIIKLGILIFVLGSLVKSARVFIIVSVHERVINKQKGFLILFMRIRAVLIQELVSIDSHAENFIQNAPILLIVGKIEALCDLLCPLLPVFLLILFAEGHGSKILHDIVVSNDKLMAVIDCFALTCAEYSLLNEVGNPQRRDDSLYVQLVAQAVKSYFKLAMLLDL